MSVYVLEALAVLLGATAAFLAARHFLARPQNVLFEEEWKLSADRYRNRNTLLYTLLGMVVCFLAGIGITGRLHLAVAASLAGIFAGRAFQRYRQDRRKSLLRSQYAQVIGILVSALQGGLSPYQALEDATPSMPQPAREVFVEILRRVRTGSTYVEAIEGVAKETGWRDLDSLVTALKIYSQTGCNLVEVLKYLQESVTEQESDRRYMEAVTAEIRITARVLSVLPFFLMGITRILAPEFVAPLFDTLPGNIVIAVIAGMVVLGNAVIARMVDSALGRGAQ